MKINIDKLMIIGLFFVIILLIVKGSSSSQRYEFHATKLYDGSESLYTERCEILDTVTGKIYMYNQDMGLSSVTDPLHNKVVCFTKNRPDIDFKR